MSKQIFNGVWDAIKDSAIDAADLKLRSSLMMALSAHIDESGLSQMEAAAMLGVMQWRISDLVSGKIEAFSLNALVDMAARAGLKVRR